MRWTFIAARAGVAVLILVAATAQLGVTVEFNRANNPAAVPTAVANFLSFFTIQSNLIGAVALAIGAVLLLRARDLAEPDPPWFAVLLAAASTYLITTGIVYNVLLRGVELPQGLTVPWSNEVLHVVAPLYLLIDLLFAPRRRHLAWRAILAVVAYPIAWVIYTLIRGPLTTAPLTGDPWWYPYPFLDPHLVPGGYLGVTGYVAGIAVVIAGVAALVIWHGRVRGTEGDRSLAAADAEPGDLVR